MGNNNALVLRSARSVLTNNPHDSANELNIGRQRSEGAKHRSNSQWRMVKTFTKHLDLDDDIKRVIPQIIQNVSSDSFVLPAMNRLSFIAKLAINFGDRISVVGRASSRDDLLMATAHLPQFFTRLDTGQRDASVAGVSQRNATAKPSLFAQFNNIGQGGSFVRVRKCKCQLGWSDMYRLQCLDVAATHGFNQRVMVDEFSNDFFFI